MSHKKTPWYVQNIFLKLLAKLNCYTTKKDETCVSFTLFAELAISTRLLLGRSASASDIYSYVKSWYKVSTSSQIIRRNRDGGLMLMPAACYRASHQHIYRSATTPTLYMLYVVTVKGPGATFEFRKSRKELVSLIQPISHEKIDMLDRKNHIWDWSFNNPSTLRVPLSEIEFRYLFAPCGLRN